MASGAAPGPVLAVARNRAVDDLWIDAQDGVVTQPKPRHDARAKLLDEDIRAGTVAGGAGPFGQRLRVRHGRFASPWFHYVMTSPDAFATLVEESPWRIARIVDDGSPRYGVVLEKRRR